jgi:hypothetical protein
MPPSVRVLRAFVSLLEKRFADVIQGIAAFLYALHAPLPAALSKLGPGSCYDFPGHI